MKYYHCQYQQLKTRSLTRVIDKTDSEATKPSNPAILMSTSNHLAEITLNRPDRLNSFNPSMHKLLYSELEALEQSEDCRAILLTGTGRAFCTGQDLNDRDPRKLDGPPDLEATLTEQFNPLVKKLRGFAKPVICAVNGVAAGAGANLALACDVVFAAESAKFIQSFAKVGLLPDAGGSWMLPRLIGEARAKAVAMSGLAVTARQAANWGMIWQSCEDDALMQQTREFALALANGPTRGIAATKHAIQQSSDASLEQHLTREAQWQGELGRSHDYREGVLAFLEKRTPEFTGN